MTTVDPIADPPVGSGSALDGSSEGLGTEAQADLWNRPYRRRGRTSLLSVLVLLGLALVLALAPMARLAARRLPLPPNDPAPIVAGASRPGTTAMRSLPVGLPARVMIAGAQDVYPYAVAAFGEFGAQAFMDLLLSPNNLALYAGSPSAADFLYPYHYSAL
jgi:hypothetical protein